MDHIRMSGYPNLEYSNLYNALAMLLDVAPSIQYGIQSKYFDFFCTDEIRFMRLFHPSSSIWKVCASMFRLYNAVLGQRLD